MVAAFIVIIDLRVCFMFFFLNINVHVNIQINWEWDAIENIIKQFKQSHTQIKEFSLLNSNLKDMHALTYT